MMVLNLGLQALLDEPNCGSPANPAAAKMFQYQRDAYEKEVKAQAKKFALVLD
jgi:ubiquitin-protein ligase